jgi:sporulation protein YlmC with PRC-barrel domain
VSLNDLDVWDRSGEKIGTIEDTFLDVTSGRVVGFQIRVVDPPDFVRESYMRRPHEQPDLAAGRGRLPTDRDVDLERIGVEPDYVTGEGVHRYAAPQVDAPEVKFFLPVEKITAWDDDGVRVDYDRDQDEMYRTRYPAGYDEATDYPRRRAA